MSTHAVEALLNRVGKRVFVDFYDKFRDRGLAAGEVVLLLPRAYTLKSRWSRTSKAPQIFREGLKGQALRLIADSKRVEPVTADKAKRLLAEPTDRH